ncbi:hypothetical protein MKFW12EY_09760 [Methylomonas koyamae]|nr:hypothetical protein MKFW12EY_09760 [Methylomonas koyamae]
MPQCPANAARWFFPSLTLAAVTDARRYRLDSIDRGSGRRIETAQNKPVSGFRIIYGVLIYPIANANGKLQKV